MLKEFSCHEYVNLLRGRNTKETKENKGILYLCGGMPLFDTNDCRKIKALKDLAINDSYVYLVKVGILSFVLGSIHFVG